ncbi:MAG: CRISPR system precrRNA processing endoribonuclease RAMP protein Cas6 [Epsilonproteobacteria bacterium]|nr:CRISPR system precrRNA processing endoribonuclease RAMP protein Cas6 [Campylobacterota bacterium]MBD3807223.1 CRISPR system precrRNA processing endoribonuclease RAMP protein Cas6 [Campylobacterota bacterium]
MKYHVINVKIDTKDKPSYFMGSTLRGTFGHALKKVTCINPSYQCENCFAAASCIYYDFYEKPNAFHRYRFEIALGSERFDFGLYLFDDAIETLPYVLSALHQALTQYGLSKNRYKFDNFTISVNDQEVFNGKAFAPLNIQPKQIPTPHFSPNIKIKLLTPLRIKRDNQLLAQTVELEDILRSIYQKEQEFATGTKAFKLDYTPSYQSLLKALYYKPLLRKSGRQNKTIPVDGLMGELAVLGIDERSYRLLKLGEIIGVGKQTVMGLGRIEVEEI